ncbi:hypothetical protein [Pectinatus haikarae]|uniref:Uncharacterized protein n=1 Tax=Pectinatus haikarae TaxID=349096 RepID=A0ABT9Y8C0_9FIRM|nr:hypothetical protein [Pectinatus haikarae]MDQ0204083.1 hypothetical protein [Pectinatus haikarae]
MKNKIMLIKTDKCCFISDLYTNKKDSYDYNYHHSAFVNWLFDDKKCTQTWAKHWFRIEKYPETITVECVETINKRYEIKDKKYITDSLPAVILCANKNDYDEDVIDSLYEFKKDTITSQQKVDVEIETVLEVENFHEVPFDFVGIHEINFGDKPYHITSADVHHQLIDEIMIPQVLLTEYPCRLTSKQMYDITRQYVREHIDKEQASITSDYDFCFTVKKIIPLYEPETLSYHYIFARTKKEREKVHFRVAKHKESTIFEMTDDINHYSGYSIIEGLTANSEKELKEKVDLWLTELMKKINKPLCTCDKCKGIGIIDKA